MTPEERKALEELWRERLHATEQRYHEASGNYLRIHAEFAGRSMPSPDSNHALQQAIHIENEARAEYMRVLQTFTRLVLHGDRPEDEQRTA